MMQSVNMMSDPIPVWKAWQDVVDVMREMVVVDEDLEDAWQDVLNMMCKTMSDEELDEEDVLKHILEEASTENEEFRKALLCGIRQTATSYPPLPQAATGSLHPTPSQSSAVSHSSSGISSQPVFKYQALLLCLERF